MRADWTTINTIDAHTAGEPIRVIVDGYPEISGDTILAKRRYALEHTDHIRRALMWEPRGHADMYGCLLTPPVTPDGDVGVLFMHNEGFSTMCGHGIIGLVKVGIENDLFSPADIGAIRIDTPAGRVTARAHMNGSEVERVSFCNVPSFVVRSEVEIAVREIGTVVCDIAYGGAFYAYVDAEQLGVELTQNNSQKIIRTGMLIKRAVMDQVELKHPNGEDDLNFLYGTILIGPGSSDVHSRNVCVFADGEVDRSPTGTGVSGRAAIHFLRGDIQVGESITIESIVGSRFNVCVHEEVNVAGVPGVVPEVTGRAYVTGRSELQLDPKDPYQEGFFLRS